jgi:ATP phosphoribosyltransferase regulatory subunit
VSNDPVVTELVAASKRDTLVAHIDERMLETGFATNSSRTPAEIADRLMEKARLASTRLEAGALDDLERFLSIDMPLLEAPEALSAFSRTARIDLSQALAGFEARIAAMKDYGCDVANIRYRAAFGRPLDYYTGLVFEIASDGRVLAGGGRFDRLLTLLGAPEPIPAVGFSLWLDRIERLVEEGSAEETP